MREVTACRIVNSLWTSRDVLAIVLLLVLAFVGREFQLRVMMKVKSRNRWMDQFGEPILSPYEAKAGLLVCLGLLIIAGFAALLFQTACPFKID